MQQKSHRILFMTTLLTFNLLVMTAWSAVFLQINYALIEAAFAIPVPGLGVYFAQYLGGTFMQCVFNLIAHPYVLLVLNMKGNSWEGSVEVWKRALAYGSQCLLLVVLVVVVASVSYGVYQLSTYYRCSVLFKQVLFPFLGYEVLRSFFSVGIIPIPFYYWLLNRYGAEIPDQETTSQEDVVQGAETHRSDSI